MKAAVVRDSVDGYVDISRKVANQINGGIRNETKYI